MAMIENRMFEDKKLMREICKWLSWVCSRCVLPASGFKCEGIFGYLTQLDHILAQHGANLNVSTIRQSLDSAVDIPLDAQNVHKRHTETVKWQNIKIPTHFSNESDPY